MRIVWLCLALFLTAVTIQGWFLVRRLEWAARESFDIVGLLWLLSNFQPLLAVAGLLVCAGFAAYFWLGWLRE
jgi:hypothetical protein